MREANATAKHGVPPTLMMVTGSHERVLGIIAVHAAAKALVSPQEVNSCAVEKGSTEDHIKQDIRATGSALASGRWNLREQLANR